MSYQVPTIEPSQVTAGDTIQWTRSLADYPPSAGWVLNYSLLSLAGSIQISTVASGSDHLVNIAPAVSAEYVAGSYNWQSWVTNGTDRFQVETGTIEVLPDYAASAGSAVDTRSHAQKVLDSIEAVIEARATNDQLKLTIDGTALERTPVMDLLKLRDYYKSVVAGEIAVARIKQGLSPGNKILTRF